MIQKLCKKFFKITIIENILLKLPYSFDWTRKLKYIVYGKVTDCIEVQIEFGTNEVLAISRKIGYTIVDTLSFIGGFLGLFAGFSFLSAGEVIDYLMIQPLKIFKKKKLVKIHPKRVMRRSKNNKALKYFTIFLKSSSIHSFNHIGNEDKGLIERYEF